MLMFYFFVTFLDQSVRLNDFSLLFPGKTLTLVTNDPEAGLADQHYAFDNPGFLTEDASPQKKAPLKASPNGRFINNNNCQTNTGTNPNPTI
jgi:hypothetical protein